MRRGRHLVAVVAVVVAFVIGAMFVPLAWAPPAAAASCSGKTFTWTGQGDNSTWADQKNWNPDNEGAPSSDDIAQIDATTREFFVNAPSSVCELELSGNTIAGGQVFFHAGFSGITVSGDFTMSGSGVEWDGSINVEGTTTIDGAVEYGSGVGSFPDSPTYLHTQDLSVGSSSNIELWDGTDDIVVDGHADIASSTIWSNSSSASDDLGQLQLKSTASLSGDVDAEVDWQLFPGAQLDLGGHTLNIHSHSYSRWSNGASVISGGFGSGHVQFHDGTWLLVDGTVSLDSNVDVELYDQVRLADGADYVGKAQPAGTSGEFAGTGTIDWVSGHLLGAIQLDATITMVMDGGGTRYVGDGSANTAISQLINLGHLIVADGTLVVDGDVGVVNNTGEFEIRTGATVAGTANYDDVVNEALGVVTVTVPLTPQPLAPAVMEATLLNYGVIHVPAGLTLVLDNAQQDLLGDGGAITGGGTVYITDHTTVLARGTTTIEDGSTLDFNGYGSYLDAGAQQPDNTWVPAVFTTLLAGSGALHWEQGQINGHLNVTGSVAVDITDPGSGATRRVGGVSAWDPSVVAFDSPTTINDAHVSIDDDSAVRINTALQMTGASPLLGNGGGSSSAGIQITSAGSVVVPAGSTVATLDYPVHNAGTVSVGAGAELDLPNSGGYSQTGPSALTLLAGGATLVPGPPATVVRGTLRGPGTVDGSLIVAGGNVSPGADSTHPGTLTVTGDYTQFSTATLTELVGGTGAGQHDLVGVGGTATLNGTVKPVLASGYHPGYNASFTAVSAGSVTGQFSSVVSSGTPTGTRWAQQVGATTDTLRLADVAAPTARLTAPTAPFTTNNSVRLRWSATDSGGSGIASYDVRWQTAAPGSGFGPWTGPAGWQHVTTSSKTLSGMIPGRNYCFEVRARDHAGNLGPWSLARCIADVLDDRALAATDGWTRRSGSGYIDGTYTQGGASTSTLSLSGVAAERVAVWATRCPTCGSVKVYVGSRLVGSAHLQASTTQTSHEFLFSTFPLTTGKLRIVVSSSNGRVAIDAIGVRRN